MSEADKKKKETCEEGVQYLYFSIGENFGQLITDLAREKAWNDLKEGDAIVMLIENLGTTADQAREVIHGTKKFVTNDDHKTVNLVDDDWSPPDLEAIKKEIYAAIDEAHESIRKAENGKLFLEEMDILNIEVEIDEITKFVKMNIWEAKRRAQRLGEMITDIHGAHREEMRKQFKGIRAKPAGFAPDPLVGDVMDQLKEAARARLEAAPMDPEQKTRMKRLIDSQGKDPDIVIDKKFKFDSGWLDREGVYYGCEMGLHIQLAEKLVDKLYPDAESVGLPITGRGRNAEHLLEKKGWMKSTGGEWYETDIKPTLQQIATIKKWAKKHKIKKYNARASGEEYPLHR